MPDDRIDDRDADRRQSLQRLETLLQEIDAGAPRGVAEKTRQVVQILMNFHGTGLDRILRHVAAAGPAGGGVVDALADPLVEGVLLLYGLHPLDVGTRVRQALDKVRPLLRSHGGNVELIEIGDDGVVRLRMQGSCDGCPSSAATLRNSIEQAIDEKAPDVAGIEVEGVTDGDAPASSAAQAGPAAGGRLALPVPR